MQPRSQAGVREMQNVFAIIVNTRECKIKHAGSVPESLNTVSSNAKYPIYHRIVAASVVHPVISVVWKLGRGSLFPIPLHAELHMCMDSGSFYSVELSEIYVEIYLFLSQVFVLSFCFVWSFFPFQNCEFASFEELVLYALAYVI